VRHVAAAATRAWRLRREGEEFIVDLLGNVDDWHHAARRNADDSSGIAQRATPSTGANGVPAERGHRCLR
jgi:hypothetical protein